MRTGISTLAIEKIKRTGLAALTAAGVPINNAKTQLQLLLDAELRGVYSHGLLRLPRVIERIQNGVCNPNSKGNLNWHTTAFLQVDGDNGMGPVVACNALNELYARAASTGVAVAAIHDCDHLGMMAWYAKQATDRGFILIALTVSEALVHPWGGSHAMLGTNPIAIGVPAKPYAFILDMATSRVSMGKIHDYANRGKEIPDGWALDANGSTTTNPVAAKDGAIAPFGGAKGYGLGLGFELLVTAMAGSAIGTDVVGTLDNNKKCNKGDLFIVMKPMDGAAGLINAYLQDLRSSLPINAESPVRIPGDRGREFMKRKEQGEIDVDSLVWEQIQQLAQV